MVLGLKVIEGIFEKLSEYFVVNSSRCSRVRHKASTCTDCMDVCPENAITITSAGGKVVVDWAGCSDCGKCLTACRNGVFSMRKVDRERLAAAAQVNGGSVVTLSCKQSPYSKDAVYSASTLAFFNRKQMVRLAAMGANDIALLKGDCDACGKACVDMLHTEMDAVTRIFALCGNQANITLTDKYEPPLAKKECASPKDSMESEKLTSRREFFGYLKSRTMASVGTTIHHLTENNANNKKTVLSADSTGTELEDYINSLKMIGGDILLRKMMDEGLLNEVHMDKEKCSLCGVCSRMCPNGVFTVVTELIKGLEKTVDIRKDSLLCTDCGLCSLSCLSKAISISNSGVVPKPLP